MGNSNDKLSYAGRLTLIRRLEAGWTVAAAAKAQGISRSTATKWRKRYREEGEAGLRNRSSRPLRMPTALGEDIIEAICRLRRELGVGPHRIAYELNLARSTVYAVLKRCGLQVLKRLDRSTRSVIRYERDRPGELIHLDIKKLGRIPDGGGKRFAPGWKETKAARKGPGVGSDYMHIAIDDHSRYAYVEALSDETGPTAADFLRRAVLAFAQVGITVERVLTDNGGCYRSNVFRDAAEAMAVARRRTRPFRPQTNGKAEAFNKTLQNEWAYRREYLSNAERRDALLPFMDDYNYARPHTSIGNLPPASRL